MRSLWCRPRRADLASVRLRRPFRSGMAGDALANPLLRNGEVAMTPETARIVIPCLYMAGSVLFALGSIITLILELRK